MVYKVKMTGIVLIIGILLSVQCNRKNYSPKSKLYPYVLGFVDVIQDVKRIDAEATNFYFINRGQKLLYRGKKEAQKHSKIGLIESNKVIFNFKKGWSKNGIKIKVDSLVFCKTLLDYMVVGGSTSWSNPILMSEPVPNSHEVYLPPDNRIDLMIYYYIYYRFYGIEQSLKNTNQLAIKDTKVDRTIFCYPQDSILVGNPTILYSKLPKTPCNDKLAEMHQCFLHWIERVERVGWQVAKQKKLSPFDDCSCRIGLVLPLEEEDN